MCTQKRFKQDIENAGKANSAWLNPSEQEQGQVESSLRADVVSIAITARVARASPQGYPQLLEHHWFVSQVVEDGDYDLAPVLIGNEKRLVDMHLHIVIGDAVVALNTSFQLGLT
ncbi:hypothetical protein ACSBR2_015171 [Camellia fascicularis]